MFGGTAKTYCLWPQIGKPFKENGATYIKVINPKTNTIKQVRWYSDKAHAELMPNFVKEDKPLYALFGFEHTNDYIVFIKENILSSTEKDFFNIDKNWRFCRLWGGIWYAPKNTSCPVAKSLDKIYWYEFQAAAEEEVSETSGLPNRWSE